MTFEEMLNNIQPIEGFSVLQMKQDIQEQINRETSGMSSSEFLAYIRRGSECFRAEQSTSPPNMIAKSKTFFTPPQKANP